MSDVDDELPPDATVAARLATYVRAGGVITPLITLLIAFLVGGLVVLVTGHDPIATYKAIFNGTGLNWFFPWISAEDRTIAAMNLQQTLIVDDAADPHRPRGRVRVPLRPVQHRRPGPVHHRRRLAPSGSARPSRACRACCTSSLAILAGMLGGAFWAGHRRAR